MELKVVGIGNSSGLIVPKTVMQLFEIKRGDLFNADFTKNKIILNKIQHKEKLKPKPMKSVEKQVEDEPIEEPKEPIKEPQENKELLHFREMILKLGKLGREGYNNYLKTIRATNEERALLCVINDVFICPTCGERFPINMSKEGDELVRDAYIKAKMFVEHVVQH